MQSKIYNSGEKIITENSPASTMCLLQEGKVRVYKTVYEQQVELATMGRHDFFGEISMLLGRPHSATVDAAEEGTEILSFSKETLVKKLATDPEMGLRMITIMAQRIAEAHKVITKLEGEKSSLEIMYKDK